MDRVVRLAPWIALAALLIVAPFFIYPVFLMKVLALAIFACAYNLMLGHAGMMAFGHAAFFGVAAYVTGYTCKELAFPTELAVLAGVAAAALLGLLFGLVSIRRQGIYFAMITLALSQLVFFLCLQSPYTGSEDGLQQIPRRPIFGVIDIRSDYTLYVVVALVFVAAFLAIRRIVESPFGEALRATKANEPRMISLGYDVERCKLLAFTLSAAFAGLAGGIKVMVLQLATLTDVSFMTSGDAILMTIIGGLGTIWGPAVGAAIFVWMQSYLASLGEWVVFVQGLLFVVIVLWFPRGVIGEGGARLRRWREG
jgi:branched-chain amino acid transport system permease protein